MAKGKKPTLKEVARAVGGIDGGLRQFILVFQDYLEFKGDLVSFNQYMAEKQKERARHAKENPNPDEPPKVDDGNTD